MSRESILNAIKQNQPDSLPLPPEVDFYYEDIAADKKFEQVLGFIGGHLIRVKSSDDIVATLDKHFAQGRWVTTLPEFAQNAELITDGDPHLLQNVDVAIVRAHFGVAENGAVWVTEELMGVRVLPFITQQLVVLLHAANIVPLMQQAYARIADADYGWGGFIAGPSKTADIEQSLVIGAHGPRGFTVLLIEE